MPHKNVFPGIHSVRHLIDSASLFSTSALNSEGQMIVADEYLPGRRLFRRLKNGCHGQLIECCASSRLYERQTTPNGLGRSSHAALQTVRENPRTLSLFGVVRRSA